MERVKTALREDRLEEATEIQYREIFPLSQAIQKMQYEVMEMTRSKEEVAEKNYLIQEPLHFTKLEINLGEAPSVG